MKIKLITLLALFTISIQTAFNQDDPNNILITIDDNKITKEEFVRIYKKNNQNTIDQKSIEEYLELFINFKLKVIEAEDKGLDTLESFKKELNGYRNQLAKKHFTNTELEKQFTKESYERMKTAIRTSHILINLAPNAAPEDTLIAYNKALDARKRLIKGEDFGTVALEVSQDKNVRYNNGDIGYLSAFKKPYAFENAAYSLKIGEISMPVRTVSGYHIIKVTNITNIPGKMKVAHLALAAPQNASVLSVNTIKNDIELMYDSIKNGADFGEMAKKYSIDRQSAAKGGELPMFEPGTFVPEFEELCFKMKTPGELAGPVKTYFGWHLIKLIEIEPLQAFEEIEANLTKRIKQDPERKKIIDESILARIKKEYGFEAYPSNLEPFYALVDSTTYLKQWDKSKGEGLNDILFSIGNKDYSQQDFNDYLVKDIVNLVPAPAVTIINNYFDMAVKQTVLKYENNNLENKDLGFKHLMKEYHDGILLFELTDQMVWTKAIKDTVNLKAYYNNNKANYMWEKRAHADIYTCSNDEYVSSAMKIAPKKAKKGLSNKEVIDKVCADDEKKDCIKIESGKFEEKDNKTLDELGWKIGFSDIITKDDKQVFAYIYEILEPEQKLFNEAKGIVTADYQDVLEKEWIVELREKHKIEVNKKLLSTIK